MLDENLVFNIRLREVIDLYLNPMKTIKKQYILLVHVLLIKHFWVSCELKFFSINT